MNKERRFGNLMRSLEIEISATKNQLHEKYERSEFATRLRMTKVQTSSHRLKAAQYRGERLRNNFSTKSSSLPNSRLTFRRLNDLLTEETVHVGIAKCHARNGKMRKRKAIGEEAQLCNLIKMRWVLTLPIQNFIFLNK